MRVLKYLDRNENKETFIVFYVSVNGFNLKFSSGERIHPKYCKLKGATKIEAIKTQCPYYSELMARLDNLETKVRTFITKQNTEFDLTKQQLKQFIDELKGAGYKSRTLWSVFDEFISLRESGKEKMGDLKPYSESIIKVYKINLKKLKTFETETGFEINFKSFITKDFYTEFSGWLTEKDLHINTRAIILKTVKTFANWAKGKGYIKSFPTDTWKSPMKQGEMFALTEADLELIKKPQLNDALSNTRNWFLIQCYTGLRYSDLIKLQESDFDFKNKSIQVLTKKTGSLLKIPIVPQLEKHLKQITFADLYSTANSQYNDNLKAIAELAGFNQESLRIKYKSGVKKEHRVAKSSLFGSHLARRTFITNSLRRGIPAELVRMISGHKNMVSFQRYVRFTQDEAMQAFQDKY